MEKLYASKTFLKMAGGRMRTPHPTPLAIIATDTMLLAPLILFFFTKRLSQRGAWHNAPPP